MVACRYIVVGVVGVHPGDAFDGSNTLEGRVAGHDEELGGGERKTLEGLIAEMEEHVRHADEEARKAQSERIDMEHTRRKYDKLLSELRDKRDELMREAVTSSEKIMTGANRSIEAAIRSIKESKASAEAVREARKQVETAKENIQKNKSKLLCRKKWFC